MRVMVRRDRATVTPVEVGEGAEADAKIARLKQEHGPAVTNEDGSPLE